ncbi:MAG: RpiB/LacA/LacB family sugar-phosphate isomerase, partial [Bacilli bacterium]|nr:RpiB/LacA/LacB family sugar-phosphate isomerase [Bacilli bacterium]
MKIGIASDHGGYKLKSKIIKFLNKQKYEVIDYGTDSEESVDYTDFAFNLCK